MQNLLDENLLNQLIAEVEANMVGILLNGFIEELEVRENRVKSAVDVDNREVLEHEIHAMKSVSGTFGAMYLYEVAAKLEKQCVTAQQCQLGTIYNQLHTVTDATVMAFRDFVSHHKS